MIGASALILAGVCSAATFEVTQDATHVKDALESCGEVHGNVYAGQVAGARQRDSFRVGTVIFQKGLMMWSEYFATRVEGASGASGSGVLNRYSVRLDALDPEDLEVREVLGNKHATGMYMVELKCRYQRNCLGHNAQEIRPGGPAREHVGAPLDQWPLGPVRSDTLRAAPMHICAGEIASSAGVATVDSRVRAQALSRVIERLIGAAREGTTPTVGAR